MNVLGISCYYHDSAACLMQDGVLAAAAEEERFDRIRHSSAFPIHAVNYCVRAAGISFDEIDHVVFYEKPYLKFSRVLIDHVRAYPFSLPHFLATMPIWLQDRLIFPLTVARDLAYKGETRFIKHHLSHAASSFLISPFDRAAIITADGVGEWATTCCAAGEGTSIRFLKEITYPHSLGLLYTAVTAYLGFEANGGEGKTMGLAGYGSPSYRDAFGRFFIRRKDGSFYLDERYFGFTRGSSMVRNAFIRLLGPPRRPGEEITQRHRDIAATVQHLVEESVVSIAGTLYEELGTDSLCLAGGLFLNCLANSRIIEETPFTNVFIQPGASDAGGAVGAAAYASNCMLGLPRSYVMDHAYLGPCYGDDEMRRAIERRSLRYTRHESGEVARLVARMIADNKIVGWFQGRMEFGPRALGNRSILANPCNEKLKDILNITIKKREPFRPFAPAVLEEKAGEYFELDRPSPFMLLAPRFRAGVSRRIPAVTHADGTARVQTVKKTTNKPLYRLISEFEKITGIPMVLNTSFNVQAPMVESPGDAIDCFLGSAIHVLVLGNNIIEKEGNHAGL